MQSGVTSPWVSWRVQTSRISTRKKAIHRSVEIEQNGVFSKLFNGGLSKVNQGERRTTLRCPESFVLSMNNACTTFFYISRRVLYRVTYTTNSVLSKDSWWFVFSKLLAFARAGYIVRGVVYWVRSWKCHLFKKWIGRYVEDISFLISNNS